ncbi:type II secretion system protein [Oscillatoria laete-virens NRMC-F 0139]|nr:type II secretion system protein [Oscillatoria laete-virens]MDL5052333.1 type II secretion system protein [Oscillatoria laete-virens NRMC-F 0139]
MKHRAKGFTLIELLVVIAILAILASLAVPTVTRARVRANIVKSGSNVRQIVVACRLYAEDNRDFLPSSGSELARGSYNLLLPNYAGNKAIFRVPGVAATNSPSTETMIAGENGYTYIRGLAITDSAVNIVATERQGTLVPMIYPFNMTNDVATAESTFNAEGINVGYLDGRVIFRKSNPPINKTVTPHPESGVSSARDLGNNWLPSD